MKTFRRTVRLGCLIPNWIGAKGCLQPRRSKLGLLSGVVALAVPMLAYAAGPNSDAPPNDPETERLAFKVADGFEVNLFAAEPMLMKPIGQ